MIRFVYYFITHMKDISNISNHLTGNASQSGEDNTNPKFWKTEKRVRFFIRRICKTSAWFWFVIVLVFLNTCTIAVQHYDQPLWLEEFLCKLLFLKHIMRPSCIIYIKS